MAIEDFFNHRCSIYHIQEDSTSPGWGLPGSPDFTYPDTPDIEHLPCHFNVGASENMIQQDPYNAYIYTGKLNLPAGTDVRVNDNNPGGHRDGICRTIAGGHPGASHDRCRPEKRNLLRCAVRDGMESGLSRQDFNQYRWLLASIHDQKERLRELQDKTSSIPSSRVDGMPRGSNTGNSRVENLAVIITDLAQQIRDNEIEAARMRITLEKNLATLPDISMRLIISLRYIDLLPLEKVAQYMGGKVTEANVRKKLSRFWQMQGQEG